MKRSQSILEELVSEYSWMCVLSSFLLSWHHLDLALSLIADRDIVVVLVGTLSLILSHLVLSRVGVGLLGVLAVGWGWLWLWHFLIGWNFRWRGSFPPRSHESRSHEASRVKAEEGSGRGLRQELPTEPRYCSKRGSFNFRHGMSSREGIARSPSITSSVNSNAESLNHMRTHLRRVPTLKLNKDELAVLRRELEKKSPIQREVFTQHSNNLITCMWPD